MPVNYKTIGKRIKEIRVQQQISQFKLAEMTDMSVSYISYIENAKKQASLESLIRISDVLGVTVDELLNGNQLHNPTEYQTDIDVLMADCSSLEKRLIFEQISTIKSILRDNGWILTEKKDNY
jgi:transcriptional regulator with XRE-family HTH domain